MSTVDDTLASLYADLSRTSSSTVESTVVKESRNYRDADRKEEKTWEGVKEVPESTESRDDDDEGSSIHVRGLQWWVTDRQLMDLFGKVYRAKEVTFSEDKQNGKSSGNAIIEFYDSSAAESVVKESKNCTIEGRECVVALATGQDVFTRQYVEKTTRSSSTRMPTRNVPRMWNQQVPMPGGGRNMMPPFVPPMFPMGSMPPLMMPPMGGMRMPNMGSNRKHPRDESEHEERDRKRDKH